MKVATAMARTHSPVSHALEPTDQDWKNQAIYLN
jgi:hypothetical protein